MNDNNVAVDCAYCHTTFSIKPSRFAKSKSGNFFCSKSHQDKFVTKGSQSQGSYACCAKCGKKRLYMYLVDDICSSCSYIERWLRGEESGTTNKNETLASVRRYIKALRGEECWDCGWSEINKTTGRIPVQIDHIDGNSGNNSFINLRLMCPNCHSLTPTFGNNGGRKGKSGRVNRYKRVAA